MANLTRETLELIELVADKSAQKTINKHEKILKKIEMAHKSNKIDYFEASKKTLRIYQRLLEYVNDEALYIEKYISEKEKPRRSKDIIRYSKNSCSSGDDFENEIELRHTAKMQYQKTKMFVERVEMAIGRIKAHEDFELVKRVYIDLKRVSAKQLAEDMCMNRSTLYRRLDRLVGEFKIVLFGLTDD